ncbi:hypothetical protein ACH35V_30300 [Actinomadura sp. 1N219]|uniref:hypothetical protein n=1 Tax=Actinomadura sp. 1N219 TaxID=3375152 RepID=UPI0037B60A9E
MIPLVLLVVLMILILLLRAVAAPVLLGFIFLVALGIDYRLTTTGGVITSAGLVLAATFSVLMNLPITFMAGLGAVVAVGAAGPRPNVT